MVVGGERFFLVFLLRVIGQAFELFVDCPDVLVMGGKQFAEVVIVSWNISGKVSKPIRNARSNSGEKGVIKNMVSPIGNQLFTGFELNEEVVKMLSIAHFKLSDFGFGVKLFVADSEASFKFCTKIVVVVKK